MLKRLFLNEWIILIAILLNGVVLFVMGFIEYASHEGLILADFGFTIFFVLEMVVKIAIMGRKEYFKSGWNRFDFIIVMLSVPSLMEIFIPIPDVSFVLTFRIIRVIRIFRFMKFIPNLQQMIAGLQRAIRASVFVLFALLVYNFILAVLCSHVFNTVAPQYFSDPVKSFYTIFQIFTVEGWNDIPDAIAANPEASSTLILFSRIFFVIVVLTGGILGFSIVNAIFVDEMVLDNTDELEEKIDRLNEKVDVLLQQIEDKGKGIPPGSGP